MNLQKLAKKILLLNSNPTYNINYNKKFWDAYKNVWFIRKFFLEDSKVLLLAEKSMYLKILGDEWGDKKSVQEVIAEFILPFIKKESVVCEIGSGAGRIAKEISSLVKELNCFDISKHMLSECRKNFKDLDNINFKLLDKQILLKDLNKSFDFIYSFDVFCSLRSTCHLEIFQTNQAHIKAKGKSIFAHVKFKNQ